MFSCFQYFDIVKHISYKELQEWRAAGKIFRLIDVREKQEHQAYNIGGELIPLKDFLKQAQQLSSLQPIIVYCKKGIRSQLAIQRIQPRFPNLELYNLSNGIEELFEKG